ncbi:MAG TPA: hypothetical protein VMI31_07845 [Fimbriimonadaceae bacterium]|nr:hypothetical protein [Fimbriimonadaceae bacterium]
MLLCAFLWAAAQASLYDQVVTRHDPNNGYEDYLRAADLIRNTDIHAYLARASDGQTAKSADALDYLAAMRTATEKYGSALAAIRQGNLKHSWEPRPVLDAKTRYPEDVPFEELGKLVQADAYVKFADGDSKDAVQDLLDGMTFARHIAASAVIGEIVSLTAESAVLSTFDHHLGQVSERDAAEIVRYVDAALAETDPLAKVIETGRDVHIRMVADLLASKESIGALRGGDDKELGSYLAGLSQAELRTVLEGYTNVTNDCYGRMAARLGADESQWADPFDFWPDLVPPSTVTTPQDASLRMLYLTQPTGLAHLFRYAVIVRTRLRLLRLQAKIIEFRWHHNRLPATLAEAAPPALCFDPVTKAPFLYEMKEGASYRLYSKGSPASGEIELGMELKSLGSVANDGAVPPP